MFKSVPVERNVWEELKPGLVKNINRHCEGAGFAYLVSSHMKFPKPQLVTTAVVLIKYDTEPVTWSIRGSRYTAQQGSSVI